MQNENMNSVRQYRRGSVLIIVLIVVSSMTIIAFGLAYRSRVGIRLAQSNARRVQAYYLALGGVERIKALLCEQELTAEVITKICQFAGGLEDEGLFEQLTDFVPVEGILLKYCLKDEQGYFNVNESDSGAWENLSYVEEYHCATILDWIDMDDDVNPEGAESDYYEGQEPAYRCKNEVVSVLRELLFVKGINKVCPREKTIF